MKKQNIVKTKNKFAALMLGGFLLLAALCTFGIGVAKITTANAADGVVTSKKFIKVTMPTGTNRLGMCVYINDRSDSYELGLTPQAVTPIFNGTIYLYFTPKSGANVYSGQYVTITGATFTGTKDLYVGIQGAWYGYVTAPSNSEYEITSTLYDALVSYPNYYIYMTTDVTKVGQTGTNTEERWRVNLCTDIDKNPNNETYARTIVSTSVSVTTSVQGVLPPNPTKAGYNFVSWYYDAALTQPYNSSNPVYADTQLYAKFNPITYSITYNVNGGSISGQTTSYNIESNNITYPSPSKNGYTFSGWYENGSFTGSAVTGINKGSMGNKTVYAKYTVISYSITYNLNGGSMTGQATSFTIESAAISYPNPSKNGYTFDGWYETEMFTGSKVTGISTGSTGNKTLYAKFTAINYSITYNAGGGEMTGQTTAFTIESSAVALPIPTKTGYEFKGWYDNIDLTGMQALTVPSGSTGNKTYYAKWEILKYSVTFYVDGEVYSEMVVEYGTLFNEFFLVNMATLEVVSLFLDADMTETADIQSAVMQSMALYASSDFSVFVSLTYIVNGEEIAKDLLDYNSPLSGLRTPETNGLNFDGWFYDEAFTRPVLQSDKLTKNTTVYAKLTELENTSPSFWQKVGAWFGSTGGIITIIVVVLAVALGGVGYVIKKKRS